MKRLSWKYIAGFMDGDGYVGLTACKHKDYPEKFYMRAQVKIAQAIYNREIIELFHNNFGGYLHTRISKNPKQWADSLSWTIANKTQVRKFLQNIVRHLFIKKEQAKFTIWCIDNICGKHLPNEVKIFVSDELKAMKRDPQRLSDKAIAELFLKYPQLIR